MSERRTLQMRGEVIEEYSRDFPAEIVEIYSRPLPGAVEPVPTEPTPRPRRKKRRVWKGLLILLAVAAVIALLAAGVRWLIWELQMPDDWGEDDYYYYDQDQEDEDAPITIPTVEPDADARLELAKDRSHALSAQEVYRKVSGAVVTVAVDLDGGRMSVGTGVIFREDGYILTNHHVVAGGKTCTVLLPGGRPYAAKYIASDAGYDLAVLKINAEEALPFAEFGNSDALSVGDPVYAIGTPLDIEMGGTFTDGIVSSVNREIQLTSRTSMPLIQTNAALNNGNSGGPLIDSYGQVVGINFMKLYARYSTVEGLGFAIPSVQAERVVNDLLIYGEPQPEPLLGVSVLQVPDQLAEHLWGIQVKEVTAGGAADRAGVRAGDYLLASDGKDTLSSADLLRARWQHHVGDEMTLTLWRRGEILTVTLELTEAVEK